MHAGRVSPYWAASDIAAQRQAEPPLSTAGKDIEMAAVMKLALVAFLHLTVFSDAWAQEIPRTSGGRPDFQGIWLNPAGGAPLEAGRLGGQLVVSQAEAKALGDAAAERSYSAPLFTTQADLPETLEAAVVRGEFRTRLLVEPADGRLPYTPNAEAAAAKYFDFYVRSRQGLLVDHPEERDLSERCITVEGQPPMPFGNGSFARQIVQTPDHLLIYSEYATEARVIRIGGNFQPQNARSWYGDSVARWDGDTLLIETRSFRIDMPFHIFVGQRPVTVGPESIVIERISYASGDELNYTFTVEDPAIYRGAWLGEYAMQRTQNRIFEVACHEGNAAITNALLGGRMSELRANRAKAAGAIRH